MKKLLLLIVVFAIAFSACKDKKEKTCSLSEANLTGSYKIVSIKYKASASATEMDVTDQYLDPCEKDDILTLNANHTYVYTDAGTICSPDGSYDGDWALSGNTISVDGDPATVQDFSCSGFSLVATDAIISGDITTLNYTKQ
ncbi:MAG: lipocalin family protein [Ginsengibacter sp.]